MEEQALIVQGNADAMKSLQQAMFFFMQAMAAIFSGADDGASDPGIASPSSSDTSSDGFFGGIIYFWNYLEHVNGQFFVDWMSFPVPPHHATILVFFMFVAVAVFVAPSVMLIFAIAAMVIYLIDDKFNHLM